MKIVRLFRQKDYRGTVEVNDTFKGGLQGLGQFLISESPLDIMENVFYFTLKAPFVLKIFKFLL